MSSSLKVLGEKLTYIETTKLLICDAYMLKHPSPNLVPLEVDCAHALKVT